MDMCLCLLFISSQSKILLLVVVNNSQFICLAPSRIHSSTCHFPWMYRRL